MNLTSKSKKGNRIFKQLKTAQFQHYDSPKGELSFFSNEKDRKRLISKLSKVDKSQYRDWVKSEEGEKSLLIWDNLNKNEDKLNENITQVINKFGDIVNLVETNFDFINLPENTFKCKIKESIVDIITTNENISEKDFKGYDDVVKLVKEFFIKNQELNESLNFNGLKTYRPNYLAEMIYHENKDKF